MNRLDLISFLRALVVQLEYGCGDHGCVIAKPKGQGTNGGCSCRPKDIRRCLLRLSESIDPLTLWAQPQFPPNPPVVPDHGREIEP